MSEFPVTEPFRAKARLWLRALHRRTLDAWLATVEDLDAFMIEAASAVIAVRVLDEAVFEAFGESVYKTYRQSSVEGRVVVGLEFIRNAEIHAGVVAEQDSDRLVSVPLPDGGSIYRLFPRWKHFNELPPEYRLRDDARSRAGGPCQDAYRKHVQGRLVMETLLDSIAFFHAADPSIIPTKDRIGDDSLLPDLACRHDERRSPDWPSADRWYDVESKRLKKDVPAAAWREVTVRLVDERGLLVGFGGWTPDLHGRRDSWVERRQQVERDVRAGYRYLLRVCGEEVELAVDGRGRLEAALRNGSSGLDTLPIGIDLPLNLDRLHFLEQQPDLYRAMRLAGGPP